MSVVDYVWGTERPVVRKARLVERYLDLDAEEELLRLAYLKSLDAIAKQRMVLAAQIAQVDFMTSGGRYASDSFEGSEFFGRSGIRIVPIDLPVEKRGRGRPRKYASDAERPARPTRAKTLAGQARAALGIAARPRRGCA